MQKTRHKLFLQVITELHKWDLQSVAEAANVSVPTLYTWMQGKVISPHTNTLFPVAEAMGFDIRWVRARSKKAEAA